MYEGDDEQKINYREPLDFWVYIKQRKYILLIMEKANNSFQFCQKITKKWFTKLCKHNPLIGVMHEIPQYSSTIILKINPVQPSA